MLLILIGGLVFLLPPESGEKVSLAVTLLLAMTVFLLVVMDNIPSTSEVVPQLGKKLNNDINPTNIIVTVNHVTHNI